MIKRSCIDISDYVETKNYLGVAVINGEQKDNEESGLEDGRQSPPAENSSSPADAGVTIAAPYELFPCIFFQVFLI